MFLLGRPSKTCSAIGCSKNKRSHPSLTFFKFPRPRERCRQWIQCSRREDLSKKNSKYCHENLRFCQEHFEDSQFIYPHLKTQLKKTAVPTLFPEIPNPPAKLGQRQKPQRKLLPPADVKETLTELKLKRATLKIKKLNNHIRSKNRSIRLLQNQLSKSKKMDVIIEAAKPFLTADEHELFSHQMQ